MRVEGRSQPDPHELEWGRRYEHQLLEQGMPAGWNKTFADLREEMQRGERAFIGHPEMDWARQYERTLIPSSVRFPQLNDVYEALEDMHVRYMTSWRAPFTGGGEGDIRKGDRFRVDHAPSQPEPIGVYVIAVDYDELEKRMVPESDREHPKYSGFYFSFNTVELNEKFQLVHAE
jgi:hypothetical protein